jgi:hypothetical protein
VQDVRQEQISIMGCTTTILTKICMVIRVEMMAVTGAVNLRRLVSCRFRPWDRLVP